MNRGRDTKAADIEFTKPGEDDTVRSASFTVEGTWSSAFHLKGEKIDLTLKWLNEPCDGQEPDSVLPGPIPFGPIAAPRDGDGNPTDWSFELSGIAHGKIEMTARLFDEGGDLDTAKRHICVHY